MVLKEKYYDPVPFDVAVSIASIVGGFAGAVGLYKTYAPVSFAKSHRQTIEILDRTLADLAEIQAAIGGMQRAIAIGLEAGPRPFWLGSQVFLPPKYFTEYAANTDRVMAVLRRILRSTYKLERRISILPYARPPEVQGVVELQLQIEDILRIRGESAAVVLNRIEAVVTKARVLVEDLRRELGG